MTRPQTTRSVANPTGIDRPEGVAVRHRSFIVLPRRGLTMLMMIDTRFCCAHIHEHCITQLLKQAATRVHQACTTARTNRMYTRFATLYPPRKAYTVEFCRAARNLSDRPLLYSSAKADTATCFRCSVLYNAWLLFRNGHSMQHYHLLCGHP